MYVDGHPVAVQYSNWQSGDPYASPNEACVDVSLNNEWIPRSCNTSQRYVCQS